MNNLFNFSDYNNSNTKIFAYCFSLFFVFGGLLNTISASKTIMSISGNSNCAKNISTDSDSDLITTSSHLVVACTAPDYNVVANKQSIVFSTTMNIGGGSFALMSDGTSNGQDGIWWSRNANVVNQEILKMQFPSATVLNGFEFARGYFLDNNVNYRIEASNDGSTWTDLTGTQVFSRNTSPSIYVSGETTYKFLIQDNNTPYIYYRLYGETGQTDWNWVSEIYLGTSPSETSGISDVVCNPGTDIFDVSDDYITFNLNPTNGTGTYNVSAVGTTISPSTGTFGVATTFTLPAGSAGGGNVDLVISGFAAGCEVTETVEDPGSCPPGPCGEPDWNDSVLKASLTGDYHVTGSGCECGTLDIMVDNDVSDGHGSKNNSYENIAAFTVNFPQATILTGMEIVTTSSPITECIMRVEGSNDGTNYTAVSIDYTLNTNLTPGAAQYGAGAEAYTLPFTTNTDAYTYYRIFAVTMRTSFGSRFNELNFDYEHFDAQITNQSCDDNGTFSDYTDDKLSFDLNPVPGVTGASYEVEVDGGFTITPTSGTYGQTTSFVVSSGSSGAGDLNLSITDLAAPCVQNVVVENSENACIPGPCGGPDWNLSSIKSTLTGDYHVPGSGCECGTLGIMVDNDVSAGHGSKNNSYTNTAAFTVNFPEATVLKGMEIVTTSTPITACVMRVEGSNDGTNYTAVSIDYTLNTNLTPGAAQYGAGAEAYTLPFTTNTDAYSYYRIFAVSMTTRFGRRFNELNFDYDVFNPDLDNISFGDSGTPGVFDDDVVNFEMNPAPGTGTYDVQVLGGYTITPNSGTYGQVTNFQISEGSAGTGDLNVLLIDQTIPCVQDITIPNPDLTGTVELTQAVCTSPTDSPLATITLTAGEDIYTKAEYNIGTVYAGSGYASASDVTGASTGFDIVNTIPNPEFTTYYTIRAYATESLYRDYVVSVDPKVCSVADLVLSVSPVSDSANEGEQVAYAVTLTNQGPDTAVNVKVKIDIPVGLELLSSNPSIGEYSPGTQLWSADLVPVGSHQLSIIYLMK